MSWWLSGFPLLRKTSSMTECYHTSVHLDCFCLLAVVKRTAMSTSAQLPIQVSFLYTFGAVIRSGSLDHKWNLCLIFQWTQHTVFPTLFYIHFTILHLLKQCTNNPISAHPHQHLLESFLERNEVINTKMCHTESHFTGLLHFLVTVSEIGLCPVSYWF